MENLRLWSRPAYRKWNRLKTQFKKKKKIIKSETSDSFVNHFDGHFAYLKTLDFNSLYCMSIYPCLPNKTEHKQLTYITFFLCCLFSIYVYKHRYDSTVWVIIQA